MEGYGGCDGGCGRGCDAGAMNFIAGPKRKRQTGWLAQRSYRTDRSSLCGHPSSGLQQSWGEGGFRIRCDRLSRSGEILLGSVAQQGVHQLDQDGLKGLGLGSVCACKHTRTDSHLNEPYMSGQDMLFCRVLGSWDCTSTQLTSGCSLLQLAQMLARAPLPEFTRSNT